MVAKFIQLLSQVFLSLQQTSPTYRIARPDDLINLMGGYRGAKIRLYIIYRIQYAHQDESVSDLQMPSWVVIFIAFAL